VALRVLLCKVKSENGIIIGQVQSSGPDAMSEYIHYEDHFLLQLSETGRRGSDSSSRRLNSV
jgi:hypothetical protein